MKWYRKRLFSELRGFPLSVSPHKFSIVVHYYRCYNYYDNNSVVK